MTILSKEDEKLSLHSGVQLIGSLNKRLKERPHLFRIELLDRFYQILNDKELIFVKPIKWEDPLENIIFNAKILKDGKNFDHPAKDKIFAQCWSYEADSYALWKIYTTKENCNRKKSGRPFGVRITTTIDKLENISKLNKGKFYYGVVKYLGKKDLEKLPKNKKIVSALKQSDITEQLLKTLLVKRKCYSFEKEVRIIAIPSPNMIDKNNDSLCKVKIDPNDFITSIRFDPGMSYECFKRKKEELINKYGFKKEQISRSTYFDKNELIIKI